jgi:peptide deformylase
VASVDDRLRMIADGMLETMHSARGVGLAAQQVGLTERMCVIDIPEGCEEPEDECFNAPIRMPLKMWNPVIVALEGSQRDKEGCLSFPGIGGSLTRAAQVTVSYLDENNTPQMISARGFLARALQHEIDHLDGILYVDRMSAVERLQFAQKLKKLAKQNGGSR